MDIFTHGKEYPYGDINGPDLSLRKDFFLRDLTFETLLYQYRHKRTTMNESETVPQKLYHRQVVYKQLTCLSTYLLTYYTTGSLFII